MQYNTEIIIDKPIDRVVTLFSDFNHYKDWQPGFIELKHLDGTPGEEGSTTELSYEMGKRKIVMKQTILEVTLPHLIKMSYHAPGVYNEIRTKFNAIDGNTKLIQSNRFDFQGWGMKFFGLIMPGAFKKQTMDYMTRFKAFVESTP